MDSGRWKQVRDLFDAAVELPSNERASFLEVHCAELELRQHVERLLESHKDAGGFLKQPAAGVHEAARQQMPAMPVDLEAAALLKERYRIEKKIGEGGFGDVYLARDEQLAGRRVVLKFLRCEQDRGAAWRSRTFQKEMEALARIDHPGVAAVYDTGDAPGGQPFLVMQYVPGETLRQVMTNGPLSMGRVVRLAAQMAAGLDAAHRAGVLHRDLKPENVILREPGTPQESPVLIDFGIARVDAGAGSTTTQVAGSPLYMAPEQLLGRAAAASDQYSLALMLFEMITGEPLYKLEAGNSPGETAAAALEKLQPAPSVNFRQAIRQALTFDPAKRFAAVADFAAALNPPPRRRFGALIAVASLGALLAGVFVFNHRPEPESEVLYTVTRHTPGGETAVNPAATVFHAGDKIRLRFSAGQAGYLGLINEGARSGGGTPEFVVLASMPVAPRQSLTIPSGDHWMEFDNERGIERLWIIWSRTTTPSLESMRRFLNPRDRGEIADPGEALALSVALESWRRSLVAPVYEAGVQAVLLRAKADQIVGRIELRHE